MGSMHNDDKGMGEGNKENGKDEDERGMHRGGMAPPRSEAQQNETKSGNWVVFLICGIAMGAALLCAGLFKRRR